MSLGSIAIWIVQGVVTWLIYMDLRPSGGRLVGRALGLDSSRSIWAWLIGSALVTLFLNSRIAANEYSRRAQKRPTKDWNAYAQSGCSAACYWCGMASFACSAVVSSAVPPSAKLLVPRSWVIFAITLLVDTIVVRFVVRVLMWRHYGL
jgi:hypothetical protein